MYAVPGWLKTVTEKITKETKLYPAPINHVLVNEYLPGQGISVCTLSEPLPISSPPDY